jgi:hypothetical protein
MLGPLYRLYHFLSFAWIADDAKSDMKNQTMVTVEEDRQSLIASLSQELDEVFVG